MSNEAASSVFAIASKASRPASSDSEAGARRTTVRTKRRVSSFCETAVAWYTWVSEVSGNQQRSTWKLERRWSSSQLAVGGRMCRSIFSSS